MNIIRGCKHGLMIFNQKDVWQGKSFEVYGEYCDSEVDLFRSVLNPGDWVVDAGANIGSYTVPFARIVGETGLVVAYEPERNGFYALCGNIAINNLKNVFCFQQALSNTSGIVKVPELDPERTVNWGGLELDRDYSSVSHYPVALSTIDESHLAHCNFIKIDVEGMEQKVLEGAAQTIARYRPLLFVENDRLEKRDSLYRCLANMGYLIYQQISPFWNPSNFNEIQENVFGSTICMNVFCVPQEKQIEIPEKLTQVVLD